MGLSKYKLLLQYWMENRTIRNFSKLYYNSPIRGRVWENTYWRGINSYKCPLDLWIYQEIIYNNRPDFIIETGTASGGTALFLSDILNIINNGSVLTIDINNSPGYSNSNHRIYYIQGNSISDSVIHEIEDIIHKSKNKSVMAILDSDHSKEHVLKELEIYSSFVTSGQYLVVEDTNIIKPLEAAMEFLKNNNEFYIDRSMEKFYLTFNPCGYLRKIQVNEVLADKLWRKATGLGKITLGTYC